MNETTAKPGLSTGAKWGIGIGIGCLVLLLLIAAVGVIGYTFVKGKLQGFTTELKAHGFEKTIKGQVIEVKDPITEPAIYLGQVVKILGDCQTNLAIVAQMAEIHGRVQGKVYFRGQVLVIEPKAELLNGLDATAQVVQKLGKIQGETTGKYQMTDK